jgi:hypothetical protein
MEHLYNQEKDILQDINDKAEEDEDTKLQRTTNGIF